VNNQNAVILQHKERNPSKSATGRVSIRTSIRSFFLSAKQEFEKKKFRERERNERKRQLNMEQYHCGYDEVFVVANDKDINNNNIQDGLGYPYTFTDLTTS